MTTFSISRHIPRPKSPLLLVIIGNVLFRQLQCVMTVWRLTPISFAISDWRCGLKSYRNPKISDAIGRTSRFVVVASRFLFSMRVLLSRRGHAKFANAVVNPYLTSKVKDLLKLQRDCQNYLFPAETILPILKRTYQQGRAVFVGSAKNTRRGSGVLSGGTVNTCRLSLSSLRACVGWQVQMGNL